MPVTPARNRLRRSALVVSLVLPLGAEAYRLVERDGWHADASLNGRLGLRQGENINFGFGALPGFARLGQSTGETSRTDLQLALRPSLTTEYALSDSTLYGGVTVVAATTTLDGELSGQFARAGDRVIDTDSAYVGWRHGVLDLSVGGQPFALGDGLIIGDGNFNQGHDNGQYWIGAFEAWRNTAILKVNTAPLRGDVFWLRTDQDLGDSRIVGANVENADATAFGRLSVMTFEVIDDNGIGFEDTRVWSIRGGDLHHPALPGFALFGEYIRQTGDSALNGVEIDAEAWYIEPGYQFANWRFTPKIQYRYSYYSGDDAATAASEEYRGMFFTFGKRGWDTWYQGEVNGEFFLFNQNQVSHMVKLSLFPSARHAVKAYYYHHALDTPQYFGVPTTATDWSDEFDLQVEFYPNDRLYGMVGVAWATPNQAARDVFGDDDQVVFEFFLSYTLK